MIVGFSGRLTGANRDQLLLLLSFRPRFTITTMVTITFPDRDTEERALAFLLGRFSGRVLRSGEHIVPEAALEALADQNIPFFLKERTEL